MSMPSSRAFVVATPEQVAAGQRPLQLPPLLGQVAAAVGVHPPHEVLPAAVAQQPAGLVGDGLGAAPGAHERQRAGTALHEVGQQPGGVGGGGPAQRRAVLAGALGQRRLPQGEGRPRPRRPVVGHRDHRLADQPGGGRGGLGDGRRGEHEHRLRAVAPADPAQPAQHVADVGAEDAAVGVALVDDDVGAPGAGCSTTSGGPAGSRGAACRGWSRSTASAGAPSRAPRRGCRRRRRPGAPTGSASVGHRGQLVAGQRLGGGEVEDAGPRVLGQPAQRGQLVGQRLARRRPRGDDDVPAVVGELRGLHLVG